MARQAHTTLIVELLSLLRPEDRTLCQSLVDYLQELDYTPQRQKVQRYVLTFKNHALKQTIAKIGVSDTADRRAAVAIKFYACKHPSQKFRDAVQDAIESTPMQYRCCGCGVCGAQAEDRGYRYVMSTGEVFIRCGAYVVAIPNLVLADIDDIKSLLLEQHAYFLARAE
ncbi:MAG: hypothetical protein ACYC5M_11815 [Anaerolineae bacterium]